MQNSFLSFFGSYTSRATLMLNMWQSSEINFLTSQLDLQRKCHIIGKVPSSLSLSKQTNKSTRITRWLCIHTHTFAYAACIVALRWKQRQMKTGSDRQSNWDISWIVCARDVDRIMLIKVLSKSLRLVHAHYVYGWMERGLIAFTDDWIHESLIVAVFFFASRLSNERASERASEKKLVVRIVGTLCSWFNFAKRATLLLFLSFAFVVIVVIVVSALRSSLAQTNKKKNNQIISWMMLI